MIVKVITLISFVDKKENTVREVGEQFEVSETRYKEILRAGAFIEKVPAPKKSEK